MIMKPKKAVLGFGFGLVLLSVFVFENLQKVRRTWGKCDELLWEFKKNGALDVSAAYFWIFKNTGAQIWCATYFLRFGFRLPENGTASSQI